MSGQNSVASSTKIKVKNRYPSDVSGNLGTTVLCGVSYTFIPLALISPISNPKHDTNPGKSFVKYVNFSQLSVIV